VKLLVVAPQPFFSPRGTPFSVYYRTQVTCQLGHEVDLLTYGQGADVDIPGCRIIRTPAFSKLGAVRIGPSMLKLFHDCFMFLWTVGLLSRGRYDVVHAHEEAVFWCRWLKPVFRFRLIHDMHSSLPQQLYNFRFTSLRAVHWVFEQLEESAARAAEAVITVCPALTDYARNLTVNHDKVLLIENSLFEPVRFAGKNPRMPTSSESSAACASDQAEQWVSGSAPGRVIAYAGTLQVYQGIYRMLEAFSVVVRRMPDAGLLIVGGSPQEVESFRVLADSLGLRDAVLFTGQVPQARAQRLVSLAGAAISPRFAGNNTPMKIYQLMASGIPLVATRIESHTQVLNDDIAVLAEPSADGLADAMLRVLGDPEESQAMADRARAWYRDKYSREVYTEKMRMMLSMVS
jgi:glycosyltransferase involved in cell wall biosynthesis